jgi:hypothetical protein
MVSSGSQYVCYFLVPWTINLEELYPSFSDQVPTEQVIEHQHGKNRPCGLHTYLILSAATAFSFAALHSSRSLTRSEYGIFVFFWLPIYTNRNEQHDEICNDTKFQLHPSQWKESTKLHNFGHLEASLKKVAYSHCVLLSPNLETNNLRQPEHLWFITLSCLDLGMQAATPRAEANEQCSSKDGDHEVVRTHNVI